MTTTAELIEQVRKVKGHLGRPILSSHCNDEFWADVYAADFTALFAALERLQKMEQKAAMDKLTRMGQEDGIY